MTAETVPSTRTIAEIPLRPRTSWRWWLAVLAATVGLITLLLSLIWLFWSGLGIWGNNLPFVWGFDLTNYVWWIGIANGASLFASILVLRRHGLRTSVNRFAEALALFAAIAAGFFPIIHLGRPELFYWLFPYPSTFQVWPQFRSPLTWDFWAISTHIVITTLLWYVGLIPDLATLRDRAQRPTVKRVYGLFALGWHGSSRQWAYHQRAYRLVAGMVLPLVLVLQSAVAFEFASTLVPDWHETRQPLHFVITGLASGLATVLFAALLLRHMFDLHQYIDDQDVHLISYLLLANVLVAAYLYGGEIFVATLSDGYTRTATFYRFVGSGAWTYWSAIALIVIAPQILWSQRARLNLVIGSTTALGVMIGVWLDRYSIVVWGIERDYLPALWGRSYTPTLNEWLLLLGTVGLFALLFCLFVRYLPVVSMFETRHEES